jgi:hypothetical protein
VNRQFAAALRHEAEVISKWDPYDTPQYARWSDIMEKAANVIDELLDDAGVQ